MMNAYSSRLRRRAAALLLAASAFSFCAGGAYAEAVLLTPPGVATPGEAEQEPSGGGTTPSVSQFDLSLSQSGGKITATISGASSREVEITISLNGSRVDTLALIGSGSATSTALEAGTYTVRAEYVTPADGVTAVTKTIEVTAAQQETPAEPTVKQIEASVSVSGDTVTITVVKADNYPLYAAVGDDFREIVHGTATFSGLADGSYDVEVDYITAISGVSPYRTSVTVGSSGSGTGSGSSSGETQTKAPIAITLVVPGENQIVVCGTAEPATDITLTTSPASTTAVVRSDASGAYAGVIKCAPGTYTAVYAQYGSDSGSRTTATGAYSVTGEAGSATPAPVVKPALTVDPVYSSSLKVYAYCTPGTLVNLGVKGYGQTLTADKNGCLVYSLPQTYKNGTTITFTVFYGEDNKLTYTYDVIIGAESTYRTLMKGSYGDDVLAVTQRLQELGYPIKPSKTYTVDTVEVVKMFQRNNGLDVDGMAGKNTQTRLFSGAAIGMASSGETTPGYGTLSRSTRYNSAVVPMQKRLRELGYPVGKVDGYFGSQTYRAVVYFQRINGISPTDGVADPGTLQLLYSAAAKRYNGTTAGSAASGTTTGYRLLYWGSKGEYVRRLQSALLAAGYSEVRVADGIFGKWTYDAVVAFQKDNGLLVDGIAGKQTQNKLYGTSY